MVLMVMVKFSTKGAKGKLYPLKLRHKIRLSDENKNP